MKNHRAASLRIGFCRMVVVSNYFFEKQDFEKLQNDTMVC